MGFWCLPSPDDLSHSHLLTRDKGSVQKIYISPSLTGHRGSIDCLITMIIFQSGPCTQIA